MARPQKQGLNYYPKDVDIFSDRKIKIVMARYGADGYTLYDYLLCEIYKEGYYMKTDDDLPYIIASDLNMSVEKIGQILNFLLERSLFDDKLFKSDKVLTSTGIQKRYQEAVRSRATKKTVLVDERYWLLSSDETSSFIEVRHSDNKSENNYSFSEINPYKSENNSTKESKEKKSKGKKSIYERIRAMYNETCVSFPRCASLSDNRKKAIGARLKTYSFDDFKSLFEKAEASAFLKGANNRNWNATFDWLIKDANMAKVLDGNYDDKKKPPKDDDWGIDFDRQDF